MNSHRSKRMQERIEKFFQNRDRAIGRAYDHQTHTNVSQQQEVGHDSNSLRRFEESVGCHGSRDRHRHDAE
jgi:hypothetical protein